MSRPPNHVPWATTVDVDELTVYGDMMHPFPPPDDARFRQPPVVEWVPDPAYVANGASNPVTPAALGSTPKSPPGPPPDITPPEFEYDFDTTDMHSPKHAPHEENPDGGGGLIADMEVPPRSSSSMEAAAANDNKNTDDNNNKPSVPSPTTGGVAVSLLATEFVMCDGLEEGEIPQKLVRFFVQRYHEKNVEFRFSPRMEKRFSISQEVWSISFNKKRLKGCRARFVRIYCCASLVLPGVRLGLGCHTYGLNGQVGRSCRLAFALLWRSFSVCGRRVGRKLGLCDDTSS